MDKRIWFGINGTAVPRVKKFLSEMSPVTPATLWFHQEAGSNDSARREILNLIKELEFETAKPEKLLQRIIYIGSDKKDVVVDFFSGSGTTGAVAQKMGRQYILIEQMEDQARIIQKRLKKVIEGEQGGISKVTGWKGGGDFVCLELMKWNKNFVEKIQKARTKEDFKKLWKTIKEKAFLSYKVEPKVIDEHAKDFADLSIEDQKRFLLECLDKNHLYVNYSEIDDEEYGASERDKRLNKEFYKK